MPLINIGLHKNTGGIIPVATALTMLRSGGAPITDWEVIESDSEPTLVAALESGLEAEFLNTLSIALAQDCVAYVDREGGNLYGPKADEWGPFNAAYFFTLAGERLAELA